MIARIHDPVRILGVALAFLGASSLLVPDAAAERVQHTFHGVVEIVTDGTNDTVDLTGTFAPGQSFTLVVTTERTTTGNPLGGSVFYLDAITEWSLQIGSYTRVAGPVVSSSGIAVTNGVPDSYDLTIPQPYAPPVNNAIPEYILLDLIDEDGMAFADDSLPRVFPDVASFESRLWSMLFVENQSAFGSVGGSLTSATTPTVPWTWGRLKAGYRH